jgi:hypothetical protein
MRWLNYKEKQGNNDDKSQDMFMSGWRRGEGLGKRTQSFEGNYIMS